MLLNAANSQGYSVYRFLVIKGKPAGGIKLSLLLIQIRVKEILVKHIFLLGFTTLLMSH